MPQEINIFPPYLFWKIIFDLIEISWFAQKIPREKNILGQPPTPFLLVPP